MPSEGKTGLESKSGLFFRRMCAASTAFPFALPKEMTPDCCRCSHSQGSFCAGYGIRHTDGLFFLLDQVSCGSGLRTQTVPACTLIYMKHRRAVYCRLCRHAPERAAAERLTSMPCSRLPSRKEVRFRNPRSFSPLTEYQIRGQNASRILYKSSAFLLLIAIILCKMHQVS